MKIVLLEGLGVSDHVIEQHAHKFRRNGPHLRGLSKECGSSDPGGAEP